MLQPLPAFPQLRYAPRRANNAASSASGTSTGSQELREERDDLASAVGADAHTATACLQTLDGRDADPRRWVNDHRVDENGSVLPRPEKRAAPARSATAAPAAWMRTREVPETIREAGHEAAAADAHVHAMYPPPPQALLFSERRPRAESADLAGRLPPHAAPHQPQLPLPPPPGGRAARNERRAAAAAMEVEAHT